MNTDKQQAAAATAFARKWQGRGYEKGESQIFWTELLAEVFGVADLSQFITFEQQVRLDHTSFIDAYIPSTHVMIEQKSLGKSLTANIRQSDGTMLSPIGQAKRYAAELPYSQRPRWIVTCNFEEFNIYDMESPTAKPVQVFLSDLGREYYRLQFLVETDNLHLQKELEVSMKAGEIVGQIYDHLITQYIDPTRPETMQSLNILCVRLVFCLYAEDAGIFGRRDMFHDYLAQYKTADLRNALMRLFDTLDTPPSQRDPYLKADLAAFPYTNGGLFARRDVEIPQFTDELRNLLLQHASLDFDWSQISPTIFGGVFESTLNPETRRKGGMHYTSIENIHRAIDPLFLDDLQEELKRILHTKDERRRRQLLTDYQQRLASLTFFDPACGSGNFLTETYLSLRRLENRVIQQLYSQGERSVFDNPIKVSIHQFHGIEVNDFAVTVATTALWISEAQMMAETERIISHDIDFLPLKSYANIHEGNALRIEWPTCSYIIGNPPFIGARMMSQGQKQDMLHVFGPKWRNLGNIDYVGAWYLRATELMQQAWAQGHAVRTALVSTNSIAQGEQVANLWQPLMAQGVHIDFAHRTFRWDSEAQQKAHVHCVIIGFSVAPNDKPKRIFDGDSATTAHHINAYLMDAPDTFVGSRQHPLSPVPEIGIGNKPIDGGFYLFTRDEMQAFIAREPQAATLFHPWYGAQEFLHQQPRYCLWLGDCSPGQIARMPLCRERVAQVREYRLQSPSAGTRKLADRPTRFHVENMPQGDAILIPCHSSDKRQYVPMGFIPSGTFASNAVQIIPNATLAHFAVLESSVHMAWMRTVCGRLETRYRYSKDVVYNNFVWPSFSEERRAKMEETAQAILSARALYPDSSLADLYDPVLMPPELRRAHAANDRAVLQAYGWPRDLAEQDIVARLFALYEQAAR